MLSFRSYFEALKFNQPRQQINTHPLVQGAKFGIEIEFSACAAPFEDMRPEWLAYGLYPDTDEEIDLESIKNNKKQMWDQLISTIRNYSFSQNEDYQTAIIGYWSRKVAEIIDSCGFQALLRNEPAGQYWAVGDDGIDQEIAVPLLEVRSGILTQKDFPNLLKVFENLSSLVKQHSDILLAKNNTGFHIHVSNSRVSSDIFSRLAAASDVDEDWIWDVSASHDRSFEKHAALNKPQNFTTGSEAANGGHDQICSVLYKIMQAHHNENPVVLDMKDLADWFFQSIGRDMGVNLTSRHPTIEYRYLSSALVVENPQKAIDSIEYFVQNTAQLSNKNRLRFETSEGNNFILTLQPMSKVRIDYIPTNKMRDMGDDRYGNTILKPPRIPKTGMGTDELRQRSTPTQRHPSQPFRQWLQQMSPQDRYNYIKNKKRNTQ